MIARWCREVLPKSESVGRPSIKYVRRSERRSGRHSQDSKF